MTTRSRRTFFLVLIPVAALVGMGLRLAQPPEALPPPLIIPADAPLIEPKGMTMACASNAKFTLAKMYGVDGQHSHFKEVTKVKGQVWRVTGEIRAYQGQTVQIYPYDCVTDNQTSGTNIHPQTGKKRP